MCSFRYVFDWDRVRYGSQKSQDGTRLLLYNRFIIHFAAELFLTNGPTTNIFSRKMTTILFIKRQNQQQMLAEFEIR